MHARLRIRTIIGLSVVAASLIGAAVANAVIYDKVVPISWNQEPSLPFPTTTGTGTATVRINTTSNTLDYNISYSGLSSTETAAHIHGFAGRGVNAGVLIGLPAGNPKIGTWTYLEAQEANILAGQIYFNIHTSNNPGGEIRGQIDQTVNPVPASSPVGAIVLASALLGGGGLYMAMRRRRETA